MGCRMTNSRLGSLIVIIFSLVAPQAARSEGLLRSVWGCSVPCQAKETGELLGFIHVTYCSTSALSLKMIETLSPVCQSKTKRADAVAARKSFADVATCVYLIQSLSQGGIDPCWFFLHFHLPFGRQDSSEIYGVRVDRPRGMVLCYSGL